MQKDASKVWQKDITAVYIAASYQMLKSTEDANQLINQYTPNNTQSFSTDFYDSSISDAQYFYIIAKHFPSRLNQVADKLLTHLVQALNSDEVNTVLSGFASLALGAYQETNSAREAPDLSMTETMIDHQERTVPAEHTLYQKHVLSKQVLKLIFNNPSKQTFFYQLLQAGFDQMLPKEPIQQGMELYREYRDSQGHVIQSTPLGSEIEVHIQIRALDNTYLTNIAIEDLLPGGFEVVRDSVKNEPMDYSDVREDRVNFFGSIDSTAKEIVYKIKAINTGKYTVPPAFAEAMYNPDVKARGLATQITITELP